MPYGALIPIALGALLAFAVPYTGVKSDDV